MCAHKYHNTCKGKYERQVKTGGYNEDQCASNESSRKTYQRIRKRENLIDNG